jgi:glyoxylase-like metal-dependent hydrolase (beta-lactamase superfamily II)
MLVKDPPREIVNDLWMLGTNPYPLYLSKGIESGTIFEGGTGAMGFVVRDQLQTLGIGADFVTQVVLTHAHPDHVMAVPLLREMFPSATVLASEAASKTLRNEKAIASFCQMDDTVTDWLIGKGLITDDCRRPPVPENEITVDRLLKEGNTVDVDEGISFQVIETPGHSECSLSFFEPNAKVLIISDATGYYLPDDDVWWPNYFSGYGPYVASIEKLAQVGAGVLCLSHNAVIQGADDVAAYFRNTLDATRRYHERIVAGSEAGKTVREIAETLGEEVYEKTKQFPVEFFQKNCGLLAKLSLAHEGIGGER